MKVVAGCSLDNKTLMKDFYFDDDVSITVIDKAVNDWAHGLLRSWWVQTEEKEQEDFYED